MSDQKPGDPSPDTTRTGNPEPPQQVYYAVPQPPDSTNEIDLLDVIGILWRRKWLILGLTVFAGAALVAYALLTILLPPDVSPMPNLYRPQALVLVHQEGSDPLASLLAGSGVGNLAGALGVRAPTGPTQSALVQRIARSSSFLDQIVDEFSFLERYDFGDFPRTEAREKVHDSLVLNHEPESGVMTISYEDRDRQLATDIVNRVLELLDQRMAAVGTGRNQTRMELLERKITETEIEVARLESEVEAFQQRHGVLNVQQLAEEQARALGELRGRVITKEIEISTYGDFVGIQDPVLTRLRAERDNLVRFIREYEEGFERYEGLLPAQRDLPRMAIEYAHLDRELKIQEQIFRSLREQYEVARIAQGGTTPLFQVLDVAEVPERKSGPSRAIMVILGTFAAFFFAIVLAFILNAASKIKSDPDAMRRLSGKREI